MKYVFLLLFGLLYFPINAQVDVNIVFNTDKVNNIEVWVYDNFITGSKHLAFTADRNSKASHNKQIDLQQTGKIIVKTISTEQWFYVQPAYEYTIIIGAKSINIQSEDNTDELMLSVEKLHTEYWHNNIKWPSGDSKKSFVPEMQKLLGKLDSFPPQNLYFDKLLRYKIASIKFNIAKHTKDKIYAKKIESEYLTEAIVDYTNPLQINFIAQFYNKKSNAFYLRDTPFIFDDGYKSFFNELALSKNDTVKQIATLYFIKDAAVSYWGKEQTYTNHLLDSLKKNAVNSVLQESIEYNYKQLNSLKVGDKVNDFTYYNLDQAAATLSDFKGKWILLDFWFIGCVSCHEAIPDLKLLQNKFENCLEIVGVNPIDKIDRVKAYKEKNSISWNILSTKHDSSIRSYFNIQYYPTYFLIDPAGNFRLIPNDFKIKDITKDISKIINSECKE